MRAKSSSSLHAPVGLAFFGFGLVGLNGGANGVLIPSLSAFYHVGDAVIGLLFLVSSLGYFLSALSSGLLMERVGLRWVLVLGAATLLQFKAGGTIVLICGRMSCEKQRIGLTSRARPETLPSPQLP